MNKLCRYSIESTNPITNQKPTAYQTEHKVWMIGAMLMYQYFPCKYRKWDESLKQQLLTFESIHSRRTALSFCGIWFPNRGIFWMHFDHHLCRSIKKKYINFLIENTLFIGINGLLGPICTMLALDGGTSSVFRKEAETTVSFVYRPP